MVDREKVVKRLEKCKRYECADCTEIGASHTPWACSAYDYFVENAIALLMKESPEVIRCRDCKYGEQCIPPCEERYCVFYDERHDGDWFCADGALKDNE